MTIKGVKFKDADGKKVFASAAEKDAANSVNRELEGFTSKQIVVRTSTYADFAAQPLPQGTVRHNRHLHSLSQHVANTDTYRERRKEVKHAELSALTIRVCLSTQLELCG